MALLTPVQQGKYLMALKKWRQEMCLKYEKPGTYDGYGAWNAPDEV
jgi:hypothetical protein